VADDDARKKLVTMKRREPLAESPMQPTEASVSARMRRQSPHDTEPEVRLRSALHRRGLRFRVHLRLPGGARREADVAFTARRIAVFVDGCYWHGCPIHASWPKQNADFWRNKIEANRVRDLDTAARLASVGWRTIRVWEHEDPNDAADLIERVVRATPPGPRGSPELGLAYGR
jgi:DNA mismatch endonuclease (patch repair protein)